MPTVLRSDAPRLPSTRTDASVTASGPSTPSSDAARPGAWTGGPPSTGDAFASGPVATTALRLPASVIPGPDQVAAATAKYGAEGGARVQAWSELLTRLKSSGLPEREQVQQVHDFLTLNARYETDADHYGASDYWATPTELLGSGAGDCEDFALARYASLRELGVPEDRLQVSYVKRGAEAHMVLTYRDPEGGAPWVMDNLEMDMLRTPGRPDLTPVYGFNESQLYVTRSLGDWSSPAASPTRLSAFQGWLARMDEGQ